MHFLFLVLLCLLLIISQSVSQKSNPKGKSQGQAGKADDYTKKLVKEMQGQGVPKEAIIDRIKYAAKGEANAKKIMEQVQEDRLKADARAKQKRAAMAQQAKTKEQMRKADKRYRKEL